MPALRASLEALEREHLLRRRRTVQGFEPALGAAAVRVEDRTLVNFCGNDYLGLARDPRLAAAAARAAEHWGAGSGASHLVSGHLREHAALEEALAAFLGRERALLFSTGYMANLAAIGALAGHGDRVLLDRLSHASLIDAAVLSRARFRRYRHADASALRALLQDAEHRSGGRTLVATDGLFSMDGDMAPLPELAAHARAHGAWLLVDDAHGIGVLGAHGRGSLEALALAPEAVPVLVGTLGKALGSFGAFIAGSAELIDYLVQRARSYIYTTALPAAVAGAARTALAIAIEEPWRRERVHALSARFRAGALEARIPLAPSTSPIQPVMLGSARAALAASEQLYAAGLWVAAIRPPTVPRDAARLRVTLSAAHTEEQVDRLVEVLHESLQAAA